MEYREATEVRWQSAIAEPAPNSGCGGEQEHQAAEGLALLSPQGTMFYFQSTQHREPADTWVCQEMPSWECVLCT